MKDESRSGWQWRQTADDVGRRKQNQCWFKQNLWGSLYLIKTVRRNGGVVMRNFAKIWQRVTLSTACIIKSFDMSCLVWKVQSLLATKGPQERW
jgi:hypothetical protein